MCFDRDLSVVDTNGKILATKTSCWSSNPSRMVASRRHLVALVPGGVEVQLLAPRSSLKLCQTIEMKDCAVLCARRPEGGVFLASATTGQIVCLLPLPEIKQAEQLLKAGAYEDALEISRQMTDSQVRRIHFKYFPVCVYFFKYYHPRY